MFKQIRSFLKNSRGNVLITTAIAAPVMAGFAGLAVDVSHTLYADSQLEGATEATALSIAEAFTISNNFSVASASYRNHHNDIANSILLSQSDLPNNHSFTAIEADDVVLGEWNPEDEVFTPFQPNSQLILNSARVNGEMGADRNNAVATFFGRMFDYSPTISSEVYAAAPSVPTMHALNPHASNAFFQASRADTDSGTIWVNSDAPDAFGGFANGGHGSGAIIVNGGSTVSDSKIWEDKWFLPDLLADQPEPQRPGICEYTNHVVDDPGQVVLYPGNYCGGITITRASRVSLLPGVYHIMDGPLLLQANTTVEGNDVLLHFDGPGAVLNIRNGRLDVSGREDGLFQGFVIFASRTTTQGATHFVGGGGAIVAGVIYVPDNAFVTGANVNGHCHSLCLVADTIRVGTGSYLNWYSGMNVNSFSASVGSAPRLAPTVLQPYLRPHLIFPEGG